MKRKYISGVFGAICLMAGISNFGWGQTVLYTETFDGNAGAWPAGWSVSGGSTTFAINATSSSSAYTSPNASGSYNAANGTSGTATLLYADSLSTIGFSSITVNWGARATGSGISPLFYWSPDGTTWTQVSLPVISKNSTWALMSASPLSLGIGAAGVANLHFKWVSQSGATGTYRMDDFQVSGTAAGCTPPSLPANAFMSSAVTNTTMTVGWTSAGTGDHILVIARANRAVSGGPANDTTYSASAIYGSGEALDSGFVVYNGLSTSPSINLTGLTAGTLYYFAIYEFISNTNCYVATALTGSQSTTNVSIATVCDTITHIGLTDTLTIYLSSPSGYVSGNNNYGDLKKAEFYQQSDFPVGSGQIAGAIILFFRDGTAIGTHGTSSISLDMLSSNGGAPGTSIATQSFTLTQVGATPAVAGVDYAGTNGMAFATSIIVPYTVIFPTPINLTSDFFLSVTLPTTVGDTVAILSGSQNHNAINSAWELQSPSGGNGWYAFSDTVGQVSWGSNNSLAILPLYCHAAVPTAVQSRSDLSAAVNIFPNPSAGQFTLNLNFEKQANATIVVSNILGQIIYTNLEQNIVNHAINMDLSKYGRGNYFVSVRSCLGIVTKMVVIAE